MALNIEDYFRTIKDKQYLEKLHVEDKHLMTRTTQMLEKRTELAEVDTQLKAKREVFDLEKKCLRQSRDELRLKEEKLKNSQLNFNQFIKDNDAKRSRATKKADRERQFVAQKETDIDRLKKERAVLEQRRLKLQLRLQRNSMYWNFLEQVRKMTKFEQVEDFLGRFESLLVTREQLRQRERELQEKADSQRGGLRKYLDQQNCVLLQKHNLLSQLHTELDQTHLEALRWESKWNYIQNTAEKETLLLGQIKMVTLNLYQMTCGKVGTEEGVSIDDTETQLERVQSFIQNHNDIMKEINPYASNISPD